MSSINDVIRKCPHETPDQIWNILQKYHADVCKDAGMTKQTLPKLVAQIRDGTYRNSFEKRISASNNGDGESGSEAYT